MRKYIMSIGLNDKDTKQQEISLLDAYKVVMNIFASTTGGQQSMKAWDVTHMTTAMLSLKNP